MSKRLTRRSMPLVFDFLSINFSEEFFCKGQQSSLWNPSDWQKKKGGGWLTSPIIKIKKISKWTFRGRQAKTNFGITSIYILTDTYFALKVLKFFWYRKMYKTMNIVKELSCREFCIIWYPHVKIKRNLDTQALDISRRKGNKLLFLKNRKKIYSHTFNYMSFCTI